MKRKLLVLFIVALLFGAASAQAQVVWHHESGTVSVTANTLHDEYWLFLPSGTDTTALSLTVDGEPLVIDWTAHASADENIFGVYTGTLPGSGEVLNVITSQNLRSLHLFSSDPENQGRKWLENCTLHQRETTGSIVMLRADGSLSHASGLDQLRGRGNMTWHKAEHKKPYQFKLEYKADLLETGLAHERARTWVLLSNEQDASMLRNTLALDIAKELQLSYSSRCEFVDLYYDGDYRGTYLLAEKIEVGEHSVDIKDFDKLLKPVNKLLRVPDPSLLPSSTDDGTRPPDSDGTTSAGLSYGLMEGVYDNIQVDAGGYLLELQVYGRVSGYSWFTLPDGRYVEFKSPKYVGKTMLEHVSSLVLNAYDALHHYGYHSQTGEPLENFIDVDSFTRFFLMTELLMNSTSFASSSTFMFLPEGETKLYAGPVWDYDRPVPVEWPSLKDNTPYNQAFYRTTVLQRAAKRIMREEIAPIYEQILLGGNRGAYLKPLNEYCEALRTTWHMNRYRHFSQTQGFLNVTSSYEHTMEDIKAFMSEQYAFLCEEVASWGEDEPTHELEISIAFPYGNAASTDLIRLIDEPHGNIFLTDTTLTRIEEATEESYATWRVDFTFKAKPKCIIPDDLVVYINGEGYTGSAQNETLTLSFTFEDPSYRPAVLDGVDYGYVFDYEYYVDSYPELIDLYGDDREAVLRYFRDEGMYYGDVANEFFDPMLVIDTVETATEKFGTELSYYYELFMQTPGSWMIELDHTFEPELTQVFP